MDEGGEAAWPQRFNVDELSAIQHCMNLLFRNEAAFMAEYQNSPAPPTVAGEQTLSGEEIARKTNGRQPGDVPIDLQSRHRLYRLPRFIALLARQRVGRGHERLLCPVRQLSRPGAVLLFSGRRAPHVAGRSPRRRKRRGNLRRLGETRHRPARPRQWQRDDGTFIQIGRLLIDGGYLPEIVGNAIRKIGQTAIAMPSKGIGISAGNIPMGEYEKRPGDQVGHYWRTTARGPRELRQVHFDSNYWKTLFHGRLSVAMGGRGCYSLYGDAHANHQLLGDHLSAEYRVQTQGRGRGPFGSGSPSPASLITIGSTAPSGPPLRHPCWGAVCQAVHRR